MSLISWSRLDGSGPPPGPVLTGGAWVTLAASCSSGRALRPARWRRGPRLCSGGLHLSCSLSISVLRSCWICQVLGLQGEGPVVALSCIPVVTNDHVLSHRVHSMSRASWILSAQDAERRSRRELPALCRLVIMAAGSFLGLLPAARLHQCVGEPHQPRTRTRSQERPMLGSFEPFSRARLESFTWGQSDSTVVRVCLALTRV